MAMYVDLAVGESVQVGDALLTVVKSRTTGLRLSLRIDADRTIPIKRNPQDSNTASGMSRSRGIPAIDSAA